MTRRPNVGMGVALFRGSVAVVGTASDGRGPKTGRRHIIVLFWTETIVSNRLPVEPQIQCRRSLLLVEFGSESKLNGTD